MTVEQLDRGITSKELTEWMAYYRLEPFGQERADFHSARIAAAVYNCFSKTKVSESDFMLRDPGEKPESRQMSESDLRKMVQVAKAGFAGASKKQ